MLRSIVLMAALSGAGVQAVEMPDIGSMKQSPAWAAGKEAAKNTIRNLRERPVSGIADTGMESDWRKLREAMGIHGARQLYVFISFSMPDSLIRAYALDAGYAGATLVVRGIEDDMDMRTFATKRLTGLLHPGEVGAPIQIDPRLFDTYRVDQVPTIVLATNRDEILCDGGTESTATYQGKQVSVSQCAKAEPEDYWALSGAVTTQYALEQFAGNGADVARPFLANLKTGFATEQPVKTDSNGETVNAVRDEVSKEAFDKHLVELAARNARILKERHRGKSMTIYSTPWGPAAGPNGLNMPTWEGDHNE